MNITENNIKSDKEGFYVSGFAEGERSAGLVTGVNDRISDNDRILNDEIKPSDMKKTGEGGLDCEGRKIDYLRISVTDRCNLRCRYCMPEGVCLSEREELLSFEEIRAIVEAFAKEGVKKLKITGGEPLARHKCPELIKMLKAVSGIEEITLTTNGILLGRDLEALKEAGITAINISMDTLDRKKYKEITGFDRLPEVLSAADASIASGIRTKINVAVMKDINTDEIIELAELAKDKRLDVRFIEMMPIGYGNSFVCLDNKELLAVIREKYPEIEKDDTKHGNGPAKYYKIAGFEGGIGFISAVHHKFCESCNRMRLTSMGILKYCLCYEDGTDLSRILRAENALRNADETEKMLRLAFREALSKKPKEHCFDDKEKISEHKEMFRIGG